MEDLNHIYRDPLFGIAVLIAIIAFIILADYYRNFYKKKKKERSLNALISSYQHNGFFDGVAEFLKVSKDPIPTLLFLAKGYTQGGNHTQAIKIYLTLIQQIQDPTQKIEILEGLARAYFQTGFLQKTKEIYLEILKNNPRNVEILLKLIELYESLGEYANALEALDCVEENLQSPNPQISLAKDYLQAQILIQDHQEDIQAKTQKLLEIFERENQLQKLILGYFKHYNPQYFWKYLPQKDWENYIDLLWDIPLEGIPQHIIAHSPAIEVFQAKGYYPTKEGCANFALESFRLFRQYSSLKVQLSFAYQCRECLREFPFDSFRCPHCSRMGMMRLNLKSQKVRDEKSVPLL